MALCPAAADRRIGAPIVPLGEEEEIEPRTGVGTCPGSSLASGSAGLGTWALGFWSLGRKLWAG